MSTQDIPDSLRTAVTTLYNERWNKTWPSVTKEVILPNGELVRYNSLPLENTLPGLMEHSHGGLVERDEYKHFVGILNMELEALVYTGHIAVGSVVTGHEGTGRTTFLTYLLLFRLSRALPTVYQLSPKHYCIFHASGVSVLHASVWTDVLSECWALVPGVFGPPLEILKGNVLCFVHACPPQRDAMYWTGRWRASVFNMKLPSAHDVAAIVNERGLDVTSGLAYLAKWGPCPRTILALLTSPRPDLYETRLCATARAAARKLCEEPRQTVSNFWRFASGPDTVGMDTLLFIQADPRRMIPIIECPTRFLCNFVEREMQRWQTRQTWTPLDVEALDEVLRPFNSAEPAR